MTLRALDTPDDLERFVSLTRQIRALEQERNALKETITEALQHEPPSDFGQQYVDFDGYRVELASRPRYIYSEAVTRMEKALRELKAKERKSRSADVESWNYHPRCTPLEATREVQARERKATAIAAHLFEQGVDVAAAAMVAQPERDMVARRAGQRSPSEKTWAVVLEKLAVKTEARLAA